MQIQSEQEGVRFLQRLINHISSIYLSTLWSNSDQFPSEFTTQWGVYHHLSVYHSISSSPFTTLPIQTSFYQSSISFTSLHNHFHIFKFVSALISHSLLNINHTISSVSVLADYGIIYCRLRQYVLQITAVCTADYGSMYCRLRQYVLQITAVCTADYGSLYCRLRQYVLQITAVCTADYGSMYCRLRQFVLQITALCTADYGSMYCRLRQFVLQITAVCTADYGVCTADYGSIYCRLRQFVLQITAVCTADYGSLYRELS